VVGGSSSGKVFPRELGQKTSLGGKEDEKGRFCGGGKTDRVRKGGKRLGARAPPLPKKDDSFGLALKSPGRARKAIIKSLEKKGGWGSTCPLRGGGKTSPILKNIKPRRGKK